MAAGRGETSPAKIIAYTVSALGVAVGVILILVARGIEAPNTFWAEVTRDFGVTFCLLGLVSIIYETVIREQLIDEIMRRLSVIVNSIINTDATRLGIKSIFADRSERRTPLADVLRGAQSELVLYGLALYNLAFENRTVLKDIAMTRHRRIRVLLFNIESPFAPAMEASLGTVGELVNVTKGTTNAFVTLQRELRSANVGAEIFEVRAYDTVPTFGLIGIDPALDGGRIFVEWNGVDVEGQECPGLELVRSGSSPYRFFNEQVERVWASAKTLDEPPVSAPVGEGAPAPPRADQERR